MAFARCMCKHYPIYRIPMIIDGQGYAYIMHIQASVKQHTPFAQAFALQCSSIICSPPPDLVFRELTFPRVFFSGGVFFSQTLVWFIHARTDSTHAVWFWESTCAWHVHACAGARTCPNMAQMLFMHGFYYHFNNLHFRHSQTKVVIVCSKHVAICSFQVNFKL